MIWPGGNPESGVPNPNLAASWVANSYAAQFLGGNDPLLLNARLYGFAGNAPPANISYVFFGNCLAFAGNSGPCQSGTASYLSGLAGGTGGVYKISNSDFNHRWFPVIPWRPLSASATSYASANLSGSQASAAIYGGQVSIDAGFVDINGKILAGQATEWSVALPASLTAGPSISSPSGGPITRHDHLFSLGLAAPVLDLSSYVAAINPALQQEIRASYDARTKQISLDKVNASSGGALVAIRGRIISTNTLGQIHVNGGLGNIRVTNLTGRELVLQDMNTGNTSLAAALSNDVRITDLLQPAATRQWLYRYNPADGLRVYTGADGAVLGGGTPVYSTPSASYHYAPVAGLRWEWELRAELTRSVDSNWNWSFPAGSPNNPWRYLNSQTFQLTGTPTGRLTTGNSTSLPVFTQAITADSFSTSTMNVYYHDCGATFCNFGFRRTTDNSPVKPAGTPGGQWRYQRYTGARLRLVQSVKADNPIGIDFSGNARGTVHVTSNAPLLVAGSILNPNGDTTLVAGGHLRQAANGMLTSNNAALTANGGGGIGTTGQPFKLTLTDAGRIDATSGTAGIHLDINSAARLGAVTAGSAGTGYGDVSIAAAGNILRAPGLAPGVVNVTGRNISLASRLGSIGDFGATGADGTPLVLSAKPVQLVNGGVSGGVVDASALNDVALEHRGGNLLLGRVGSTAAGNVYLRSDGAILGASGQTAAQALTPEQVDKIWQDLRLTAAYGAEQEGDAGAASVLNFQNLMNRYYQQYWRLLDNGVVHAGTFVLAESALPRFRPLAAAALGVATPSDSQVRAYADNLYQEAFNGLNPAFTEKYGASWRNQPQFQSFDPGYTYTATTGQVTFLTRNAVWTEAELSHAINRTALEPASGTPVGIGEPNVIGRDIVLHAGGGIGKLADPVFVSVADLQSGNLNNNQAAALALATTPGDVVAVGTDALGQRVTFSFGAAPAGVTLTGFDIAQTSPVFVTAAGAFRANASGVAFVQSAGQVLSLDRIQAGGNVSVAAPQSIVSAGTSPTQIVAGGSLTLLAGSGNLGASAAQPLVFQIGGDLAAASAGQNAWLRATGDMRVGRVFAGQLAVLDAAGGSLLATLDGIAVQAQNVELSALNDIGSVARPFQVQHGTSGQLDGSAGGVARLYSPLAAGALRIGTLSGAAGVFAAAEGDLAATRLASTAGPVEASSGADLAVAEINSGIATTASGPVSLTAVGDLTLGSATTSSDVTLHSGGAARVTGVVETTGGNISTSTATLDMADGASLISGTGRIELSATGDIFVSRIETGNDTAQAVTITAGGRVIDGGDTHTDIIALAPNAPVTIAAAGGIGNATRTGSGVDGATPNALETRVNTVALHSSNGGIHLDNSGGLDVSSALGAGDVRVSADGALTAATLISTGGNVSASGTTVDIDTASAGLALQVTARAGDATVRSANAGTAAAIVATGAVAVDTVNAGGDIELAAGVAVTAAQVTSTGGGLTASAPTVRIDTANVAQSLAVTASAGDAIIGTATAGGNATVLAAGHIHFGSLAAGGDTVLAAPDEISGTTLTSALGTTSVSSSGGRVAIDAASGGSGLTVTARDDVLLGFAGSSGGDVAALSLSDNVEIPSAVAGGNISLAAPAGIVTAGDANAGGSVAMSARGDVLANTVTAGLDVGIASAQGNVAVSVIEAGRDVNLSAARNVTLDTVVAGGTLTADAAGGDLRANSITANGVDLTALGMIDIPGTTLHVGSFMNFGADRVRAVVNHTGTAGLLFANAMNRGGGPATLLDFTVSSPVGVRWGTYWALNSSLLLPRGGLEIDWGSIDQRATFVNPVTFMLLDQRGFQRQPADIQFFTHNREPFQLKLYGTVAHLAAFAIHYNELTHSVISLVPGREADVRKTVERGLAIADDRAREDNEDSRQEPRESDPVVTYGAIPVALPGSE